MQTLLKIRAEQYANGLPGLLTRSSFNPHLFSGLLKCAECGSNLSILGSRGKDRRDAYYGCPGHLNRGICNNNLYQKRSEIEQKLLAGLRDLLASEAALNYAVTKLKKGFDAEEESEQLAQLSNKRTRLQQELERIAEAIANSGGSKFLLQTLSVRESEMAQLDQNIARLAKMNVAVDLKWLECCVLKSIADLPSTLNLEPERTKALLVRHLKEIRMVPTQENGEKFYVAEGEWLIGDNERVTGVLINGDPRLIQNVAGGWI